MGSVDPVCIDPLRLLLNQLSGELRHDNLQNLVHVCGEHIPGGEREKSHAAGTCSVYFVNKT